MKFFLALATLIFVSGCASKSVSEKEVNEHAEKSYLAFSTSMNDGNTKSVELLTSGREVELSIQGQSIKVADEEVYIFEVDPKTPYSFSKIRAGNYWSWIDRKRNRPIDIEQGGITYAGSFMLWHSGEAHWSDVLVTEAKEDSQVTEGLKKLFPQRKVKVGFRK